MPLRPVVKTVDGVTTVTNLENLIELDPRVIGQNNAGVFEVLVTISSGDEKHEYEVWGFNEGNGYLRAKRVKQQADDLMESK